MEDKYLSDGLLEGVEVEDDEIDLLDAVVDHVLLVLGVTTDGKNTTVNLGVEESREDIPWGGGS